MKEVLKKLTSTAVRVQLRHILNYLQLLRIIPSLPETRFVIFGQGRTGSQLLMDLLNSHPSVYCDSEIFHPYYYGKVLLPYWHIISCSRQARKLRKQAYGFKVKFYQLENDQKINPNKMIHLLHKNGWKIIYLRRDNILRHSLSNLKADRDQVYHLQNATIDSGPKNKHKLQIDCAQLLKYMKGHEKFLQREKEMLKDIPHLELVYEDDLLDAVDHQQTMNRVFQFLGIDSQYVQTDYVRTSSYHLEDLIENYSEVESYLKNTDYYQYLH